MFNLIIWLLSKLTNPAYRNELIGDLEEEYNQRLQENNHARAWVLKQAILAIWEGQKALMGSTGCLKTLGILSCLIVMPVIALFVGWLSTMQAPSEQLWQSLLAFMVLAPFFTLPICSFFLLKRF